VALRGDAPVGAKDEAWSGDYHYAYQLIEQINQMNKGIYLPTPTMKTDTREGHPTNFCIVVAGHPEDNITEEIEHLKCKINAGAEVIITQMVFSFEEYNTYVNHLRTAGINLPVLAGVRPLTNFSQADSIGRFFGIKVNEGLLEGLKERENDEAKAREFGLSYTTEMIRKLKEFGCPGVHLFILNDTDIVNDLLERIE